MSAITYVRYMAYICHLHEINISCIKLNSSASMNAILVSGLFNEMWHSCRQPSSVWCQDVCVVLLSIC